MRFLLMSTTIAPLLVEKLQSRYPRTVRARFDLNGIVNYRPASISVGFRGCFSQLRSGESFSYDLADIFEASRRQYFLHRTMRRSLRVVLLLYFGAFFSKPKVMRQWAFDASEQVGTVDTTAGTEVCDGYRRSPAVGTREHTLADQDVDMVGKGEDEARIRKDISSAR
jgi:hypothetical protein